MNGANCTSATHGYELLLESMQPVAQVRAERAARVYLTLRQNQLTDQKLLQRWTTSTRATSCSATSSA